MSASVRSYVISSPENPRPRPAEIPFDSMTLVPIGSPTPQDVLQWLEDFISDTEAARKRSLNPFERLRLRGHVGGLDTAWWLIVRAEMAGLTAKAKGEPGVIARQRVLLSDDETCRHCGAPSREIHPAGVVPGAWTCTRCGRRQNELSTDEIGKTRSFTNQLEDA